MNCGQIFTTLEQVDLGSAIVVKDAESNLTPFDRDRLFLSIYESCRHRPSANTDAKALTATIISNLLSLLDSKPLDKQQIITVSLGVLGNFDTAAATIYKAFRTK